MQPYLNQSHSEADSQDHPDVGEEPALHAGSTALMTNSRRLMWQHRGADQKKKKNRKHLPHRIRASRASEPHRSRCQRSFRWRARCSGTSRGTAAGSCWQWPCSRSSPDDRSSHSTPSTDSKDTRTPSRTCGFSTLSEFTDRSCLTSFGFIFWTVGWSRGVSAIFIF